MPSSDRSLRILQVHNRHAPGWGGEETVVDLEFHLLQTRGHVVEQFQVSNAELKYASRWEQLMAGPGMLWSQRNYRSLYRTIAKFDPHVVHVHNTFPRLSPSVFWAAKKAGVPVVLTLHNFRHACANAVLFRDEQPCEHCIEGSAWTALRHKCYANSFTKTAGVLAMNALHRSIGTYATKVDAFIALNEFSRAVFLRSGLAREKIVVKANFVPDSMLHTSARPAQVVFAGSMMRHKGVHQLLEAWQGIDVPGAILLLIGDGPERENLQRRYDRGKEVIWAGSLPHNEVLLRMRQSRVLVLPTIVYENCPMVLLEAFAEGTPVVVPDLPSMVNFVHHDQEGLLYPAGSTVGLREALAKALTVPEVTWAHWSKCCKAAHARRYSEEANYRELLSIYRSVIKDPGLDQSNKPDLESGREAAVYFK